MIKKLLFSLLFSAFSVASLNAHDFEYMDVSAADVNKYIKDAADMHIPIGWKGDLKEVKTLPDGKKLYTVDIPYDNGVVKVEVRNNADGSRDESFGPQGMKAIDLKEKL